MKVTLESTTKIVELMINGVPVPARVWEGKSENGTDCIAFITRIGPRNGQDQAEFDRDLQDVLAPSPAVQEMPLFMIL